MAFSRCNIFPDGKRGERTQLAGIQRDINWRSHGSGISNGVWETYHSKCVLISCGQARHLFTLFSSQSFDTDFQSYFYRRKDSLKKKKEVVGQIQAQQLSQSFSTAWSLNISALTFDAPALFKAPFWMKKSHYFSYIWASLGVATQISVCFGRVSALFFVPTPA